MVEVVLSVGGLSSLLSILFYFNNAYLHWLQHQYHHLYFWATQIALDVDHWIHVDSWPVLACADYPAPLLFWDSTVSCCLVQTGKFSPHVYFTLWEGLCPYPPRTVWASAEMPFLRLPLQEKSGPILYWKWLFPSHTFTCLLKFIHISLGRFTWTWQKVNT